MGIKRIEIVLDKAPHVFYTGDSLAGRVELETLEPLKIKGITLKLEGEGSVLWAEEGAVTPTEGNEKTAYKNHEQYVNKSFTIHEADELQPGTHTFPFAVSLPANIPSSYQSNIGSIYYNLKCRITKRKSDEKRQLGFSVINTLDLNELTIAGLPTRCSKSKMFGYCCFKSGPLNAKLSIPRQGFVPGETIVVDIDITNHSTKTISKSTLKLFQKDVYYAGHSKMIKQVILEQTFCSIEPGDTFRSPSTKLKIPPLPPSGLNCCKIIDISHMLQLTVVNSGIGLPLTLTQNITIGTAPLALMYDQIISPPSADSGVWSPKSDRVTPTPHYKESLFGGKQFEKDRVQDIQGGAVFTPLYPVYEFGEDD